MRERTYAKELGDSVASRNLYCATCGWDLATSGSFGARPGHALSELDDGCGSFSCIFFFLMMSITKLVVPIYSFSMSHDDHPHKTSYVSQHAPIRISEVDYLLYVPLSRAKSLDGFQYQLGGFIPNSESASASASAFAPQKSSECRVLLYHRARPSYPSVRFSFGLGCTTTHKHANARSRECGHAFSVLITRSRRQAYRSAPRMARVSCFVFFLEFLCLRMVAPSNLRRCVSGLSPYPRTTVVACQ